MPRQTEVIRRRIYALSGVLTLVGIFAMRWNVVIGGQLFSKSFLGYTTYKLEFATREQERVGRSEAEYLRIEASWVSGLGGRASSVGGGLIRVLQDERAVIVKGRAVSPGARTIVLQGLSEGRAPIRVAISANVRGGF